MQLFNCTATVFIQCLHSYHTHTLYIISNASYIDSMITHHYLMHEELNLDKSRALLSSVFKMPLLISR